mmetsp:Transcript_1796/g.3654  ORF Transcript_1796/g.3654 Transcript_1796/m.3654 type:complete len:277 (-) Transcript_1796:139-969(-)
MAASPAKVAAPLGLGLLAGGAMLAQPFALPGSSPSGLQSPLRSERAAVPVSAGTPATGLGLETGVTGLTLGAAALAAARAARRRTRRQAEAAAAVAGEAPAKDKKPKRPPPPPFDPSKQVGAIAPLGYFDPLGFSKVGDKKGFRELREAEIKHGRVAMMASIGLVAQHFAHLDYQPVQINVNTAPYSIGAWVIFFGPVGFFGLTGIFFFTGIIELVLWLPAGKEPGDLGDPLGLGMYSEDMRNKELSNGRFAMLAVMGIFAAELATGKDCIQQLGL